MHFIELAHLLATTDRPTDGHAGEFTHSLTNARAIRFVGNGGGDSQTCCTNSYHFLLSHALQPNRPTTNNERDTRNQTKLFVCLLKILAREPENECRRVVVTKSYCLYISQRYSSTTITTRSDYWPNNAAFHNGWGNNKQTDRQTDRETDTPNEQYKLNDKVRVHPLLTHTHCVKSGSGTEGNGVSGRSAM